MSHKQTDNYLEAMMELFDWVDLKRYGPPDESGEYLCAFNDNTIETCSYTGVDDIFWHGNQSVRGPYKVLYWCEIKPEWHPDYDPSPETQEEVTRIGGWG